MNSTVEYKQSLTVLVCQISIPIDMHTTYDRDKHMSNIAQLVATSLSKRSCDLLILPELSSISYTQYCFENPDIFAESEHGASFMALSQVAKKYGTYILYGAPRISRKGTLYISQFLIDNKGKPAGVYDKLHIANFGTSMEKGYFSAGSTLFVFEIDGIRLAPLICYDMRFAELAQELAIRRSVDVILHPVVFYKDASFYSWHSFVVTRALENQIYWLSVNRAGQYFGNSILCPPWIDNKSPQTVLGEDEELAYFTIHKHAIVRANEEYTFHQDRLSDYNL